MPDGHVDRRQFIKTATVAGLAAVAAEKVTAQSQETKASQPSGAPLSKPEADPVGVEVQTLERPGADFMVDVLKSLHIEYVSSNPGSSFRALQESVVNYGGNTAPEFLTCCHEEGAVAMAHGYAKIEGKPMAVFLHSNVGLQHAAMAIYNAYCDRVPVYLVVGNTLDATKRRPGVEWNHSVPDVAAMVRDFVKWDDLPLSLQHFAESAVRAYKIAMTPPMMPVLIVADGELQEGAVSPHNSLGIPRLTLASPPQGDTGAVAEAAKILIAAESPVIIADRASRTPAGFNRLIELAELLQAPVVDKYSRLNFPSRHPLNHSDRGRAMVQQADVILGLEVGDFWGTANSYRDQLERSSKSITKPGTKLISITAGDLYVKGNYQDLQRYPEVDLAIAADAEATLPALIEQIKKSMTADRSRILQERGKRLAEDRTKSLDRARADAAYAWDSSPITTARLSAELWDVIKHEDWSLLSEANFHSNWPLRLWDFDKPHQYIGGSGGAGQGYGQPAAVGAALANRKHGRLSVNIEGDGDLLYAPSTLWTAAHHKIPLLTIVHNNRAYHQEFMHLQRMCSRHNRGITNASIGTTIDSPNVNYAKLAESFGVYGQGPIEDPKDLGAAIRRAVETVKRGQPALIDVVTEPR